MFCESGVQHGHWRFHKEMSLQGYSIALWENDDTENSSSIAETCNQDEWRKAYTVQTLGMTGCPKIVRVPHRCIVSLAGNS